MSENDLSNDDEDLLRMVKQIDPHYSLSDAVKKKLRQKLRDPSNSMVVNKYTTRATLNDKLQVQENQMLFEKLDSLQNQLMDLKKTSSIVSEGRLDMGAYFRWNFRFDSSDNLFKFLLNIFDDF